VIPRLAHFVWIGSEFHFLSWAALASARRHGGFARVILHHTHDLRGASAWRELERLDVELRRIEPRAELSAIGGAPLADLFDCLRRPEAQSNLLRVALLKRDGGVYLDLDTLTVASLAPLCAQAGAFCGVERIAFPVSLRQSSKPARWAAAYLRTLVRDGCRRSRSGVRWFRGIERFYPLATNNAILAAEPDHPLLDELLDRMLRLPLGRRNVRYALGTSLLQEVTQARDFPDLCLHAPEVFYPLCPEISEHWFRLDTRARLEAVLSARTRVVHWYASVRSRQVAKRIDRSWIRRHGDRQLISALVRSLLPETVT
jgi:hypothetical protein